MQGGEAVSDAAPVVESKPTPQQQRHTGVCLWFDQKKGFGFISPTDGGDNVFVHHSEIHARGFRSLANGERVEYAVVRDGMQRKKAVGVTGPGGAFVQGQSAPPALHAHNVHAFFLAQQGVFDYSPAFASPFGQYPTFPSAQAFQPQALAQHPSSPYGPAPAVAAGYFPHDPNPNHHPYLHHHLHPQSPLASPHLHHLPPSSPPPPSYGSPAFWGPPGSPALSSPGMLGLPGSAPHPPPLSLAPPAAAAAAAAHSHHHHHAHYPTSPPHAPLPSSPQQHPYPFSYPYQYHLHFPSQHRSHHQHPSPPAGEEGPVQALQPNKRGSRDQGKGKGGGGDETPQPPAPSLTLFPDLPESVTSCVVAHLASAPVLDYCAPSFRDQLALVDALPSTVGALALVCRSWNAVAKAHLPLFRTSFSLRGLGPADDQTVAVQTHQASAVAALGPAGDGAGAKGAAAAPPPQAPQLPRAAWDWGSVERVSEPWLHHLVDCCHGRVASLSLERCGALSSGLLAKLSAPHRNGTRPCLVSLSLAHSPSLTDTAALGLTALASSLVCLDVTGCAGVTDAGLRGLIPRFSSLRSLSLSQTQASDASCALLARYCPLLTTLSLGGCGVGPAGLDALARGCHCLASLSIARCPNLPPAALEQLACSPCAPRLRHLNVSECACATDASVARVLDMCRSLQRLNIAGCALVSDPLPCAVREGVEVVREGRHGQGGVVGRLTARLDRVRVD